MASKVSNTMTVKKANCVKVKSSSDIKRVELKMECEWNGRASERNKVRNRCCRPLPVHPGYHREITYAIDDDIDDDMV